MNNRIAIEPTPIPIETCLSLADSVRDPIQYNRYWFDFPGEWNTSINNEKIVGIRSVYILKSDRRLEYKIHLRKYLKVSYFTAVQQYYSNRDGITINWNAEKYYELCNTDPDVHEAAVRLIPDEKISEIDIPIVSWIRDDDDRKSIYKDIITRSRPYIDNYNNRAGLPVTRPRFQIHEDDPYDRDIQKDGNYETNDYVERIFSYRNTNPIDDYFVDIKITDINNDFRNIMNVSNDVNELDCNPESMLNTYRREFIFKHCWDRTTCKLYSSLAPQSHKNYLGNTKVQYNPIKYFILKSTDTRFYLDFCSSKHPEVPIKIPNDESFFIEIQLLQDKKLLYI